jgi:hypothetical protein
MARKCPRAGDIVKSLTLPTFGVGYIERCEGIHVYIRWLTLPRDGHSGLQFVRRDSVEIVSSANSR